MRKTTRVADLGASLVTIAVAVLVLTTVVSRYAWSDGAVAGRPDEATLAIGAELSVGRHVKGSQQSKVVILEFSDFECQFCRIYSRDQYHVVLKEIVDKGLADYAFRHFPLDLIHPRALSASLAAECAGEQGRFWEMHDALFSQTLSNAQIRDHAANVGLDDDAFEMCLGRDSRAEVLADIEDAKRVGVAGTPTFLVGVRQTGGRMRVTRVLHGAQGLSALRAAVDAAAAVYNSIHLQR